jgi:hypothetical protein
MAQIIKLSPVTPLLCGVIKGDATCGNLARAAYANKADGLPGWQQLGLTPGEQVILPVCGLCAQALLRRGGGNREKTLAAG